MKEIYYIQSIGLEKTKKKNKYIKKYIRVRENIEYKGYKVEQIQNENNEAYKWNQKQWNVNHSFGEKRKK